jgi:hypothetical protein
VALDNGSLRQAAAQANSKRSDAMLFKTIEIEGLKIFYREAGKHGMPKLVLEISNISKRN